MTSTPSTTPLHQQRQSDGDHIETDSLSSEILEERFDALAHMHEAHGESVLKSSYHGIKVRFQDGIVSRLDGARLRALVEVGEHNVTKDVVVAKHPLQYYDKSLDYLRLEQGMGCYVLKCVLFQEVRIREELFWAFSEAWRWRVYSTVSEDLVEQYCADVMKDRRALQPL